MTAPLQDVEPFVHGQTFEEMTVGSSFRTGWRTITEADMVMFRQLVGITEPLFMDNRHAARVGLHRHAGARHDDFRLRGRPRSTDQCALWHRDRLHAQRP